MFIKKVTNNKYNKIYITYRLVKSKRMNGKPRHINILELGTLPNIPVERHKELAHKIEDFINGENLFFKETENEQSVVPTTTLKTTYACFSIS